MCDIILYVFFFPSRLPEFPFENTHFNIVVKNHFLVFSVDNMPGICPCCCLFGGQLTDDQVFHNESNAICNRSFVKVKPEFMFLKLLSKSIINHE